MYLKTATKEMKLMTTKAGKNIKRAKGQIYCFLMDCINIDEAEIAGFLHSINFFGNFQHLFNLNKEF